MKIRAALLIAAGLALALGLWMARTRRTARHLPEARIEDGKTMDYSSGRLVVKVDPSLKVAEDELKAASANVTFAPVAKPSAPGK